MTAIAIVAVGDATSIVSLYTGLASLRTVTSSCGVRASRLKHVFNATGSGLIPCPSYFRWGVEGCQSTNDELQIGVKICSGHVSRDSHGG